LDTFHEFLMRHVIKESFYIRLYDVVYRLERHQVI